MLEAKLARKKHANDRSSIVISGDCRVGGKELLLIGGPCAIEDMDQMKEVASVLSTSSINAIRGGLFKPRTSPYAFQGLGADGLTIVEETRKISGMPFISEVMSKEHLDIALDHLDILQVGSRNMQNFELLKALGKTDKPILLKRGLSSTIEELILAAEYIMAEGNEKVILCERGIRSYDQSTRNVLDLGAVAVLKQMTHLPVLVDPSHAAGRADIIPDLSRAAIACGADGLIIEAHPVPERSVSDAKQALTLPELCELIHSLDGIARAVGRSLPAPKRIPARKVA